MIGAPQQVAAVGVAPRACADAQHNSLQDGQHGREDGRPVAVAHAGMRWLMPSETASMLTVLRVVRIALGLSGLTLCSTVSPSSSLALGSVPACSSIWMRSMP